MAGVYISITTGAVALVAATAQTVLQITASSNQRVRVTEYEFSFDGTNSANTPCQVRVMRQTTAGTFSTTLATGAVGAAGIAKLNDLYSVAETIQTAAKTASTAEPTYGEVLRWITIPVFGGTVVIPCPPGQEDYIPGGSRLGVVLTAPQSVNAYTTARCEE
jgi:hypothetical protein